MKSKNLIKWFRRVAIAEGISFLVLLLVAMPLKYFADLPEAVKIVGWAHGVLFVAFLALAYEVKTALNENFMWLVKAFIAALLPFGTFAFDKQFAKEQNQSLRRNV
jgi:integral membrane protein